MLFIVRTGTSLPALMCTLNCHTLLWGGSGRPVVNNDSSCSCLCDEGRLEYNILGAASCVPPSAHTIFGAGGLLLHVLVFCQAMCYVWNEVSSTSNCRVTV